ncbi:MAG TPA: 4-hydroxy-3-methylbut-2-enyl diphosphate reductase [Candidatus Baltobacteraceae bacterium]|nr:4-hydroxy-3-methylbut-2-enyl diphosphate reductase [Candidatus Baltobacteraceae bacterium]
MSTKNMLLANPRGFCAGVDRAIAVVDQLLDQHGGPVYVRKEIVHNRQVVERLRARGAVFVEEVDEAPEGAILVFSAHGISPEVRRKAAQRKLRVVDATCPLVSKVHYEATKFAKAGLHVLLIGHADHDEVIGTMGEIPDQITLVEDVEAVDRVTVPDPDRVAVITQTTLSVDETRDIMDAVRRKFPNVRTPARDDICYATQNRQDAVRDLASGCDVMIVVGSHNSSNSLRLRELAEQLGASAYLVDDPDQVQREWVEKAGRVGVTAGASSPEDLTQAIVARLREFGTFAIEEFGVPEPEIIFTMPREISLL